MVHIGINKTGSTALQTAFHFARNELLADTEILYPSLTANLSLHSTMVFRELIPKFIRSKTSPYDEQGLVMRTKEEFYSTLDRDLTALDWHTMVFSAESLCDFASRYVYRFITWLRRYVSEIDVVAYVRHPVSWTQSVVQQRLRVGDTLESMRDKLPIPNWRTRFQPWVEAVGLNHFTLVDFTTVGRDTPLLSTFCTAASLPLDEVSQIVKVERINESMSLEAALLLNSFNRQLQSDGVTYSAQHKAQVSDHIRNIPGSKFVVDPDFTARASMASRTDLVWLNDTFGVEYYTDIFDDGIAGKNDPVFQMTSSKVADSIVSSLLNAVAMPHTPALYSVSDLAECRQ